MNRTSEAFPTDDALRLVVQGTVSETGLEFFSALVKNLATVMDDETHLRTLLHHQGAGQRHRSWSGHCFCQCHQARRQSDGGEHARPGIHVHHPPASGAQSGDLPIPAVVANDSSVSQRGAGEQILLVEDDEALRRAARIFLERAGYRVIEAKDGEDAAEVAAKEDSFFMVVTDVVMPRRNGPQMVADLRQRRPGLLVLFVSGYVGEDESLDLSAPGTAFLSKPYTAEDFLNAIQKLMAAAPPLPERI